MKLQRLAGFGPYAAFVSVAAMLVIGTVQNAPLPPSLFVPAFISYLVAFFVFAASLSVTLFDLEWLEHPATSTPMIRIGQGAMLVAIASPVLVAVTFFAQLPIALLEIAWTLLLVGSGAGLLIHCIEARRARLLHGALAWIGIVDGAFYIYLGVLQFIYIFTPKLVMGFIYGLPVTQFLYLVWAVWMGIHLIRSRSKAKATTQVAATA